MVSISAPNYGVLLFFRIELLKILVCAVFLARNFPKTMGRSKMKTCSIGYIHFYIFTRKWTSRSDTILTELSFQNLQGWETTAASAQLVEFQETILNHEKQLVTPNSPKEYSTVRLDKDLSEMGDDIWSQHASLLDHMIAEDGVRADQDLNSPKTKEIATTTEMDSPPLLPFSGDQSFYVARPSAVSGALSIVSTTKPSGGISLLRKLIFRMKKGGSKKKPSSLMRYKSSRDQYFL